jgi:rRNA maturation endonuclease Nob1
MAVEIGQETLQGQLWRLRCAGCSYGAGGRVAPERCPLCGGSVWEHDEWRPFTALLGDLAEDLPLTRDPAA